MSVVNSKYIMYFNMCFILFNEYFWFLYILYNTFAFVFIVTPSVAHEEQSDGNKNTQTISIPLCQWNVLQNLCSSIVLQSPYALLTSCAPGNYLYFIIL